MGRIVKNLQDGFIKFHGCGVYHRDGSNVLITKKKTMSVSNLRMFLDATRTYNS